MSQLAIDLIRAIILYGPSFVIKVIRGLQSDNPTPEEIRANLIQMPETFFDK